jgi:hypothetical protein
MLVHATGSFGNVASQVSDAFEVGIDFENRGDSPQVRGNGLVQGKDFQAILFDFDFCLIHIVVGGNYLVGQFHLLFAKSPDGFVDHLLDNAKQRHEPAVNEIDVFLEVSRHLNFVGIGRTGRGFIITFSANACHCAIANNDPLDSVW